MPDFVERYWTAEDLLQLPDDGNRYECIDGVLLVTPAPRGNHFYVVDAFLEALREFARTLRPDAWLFHAPFDVEIWPQTLVEPHIFVARRKPGISRIMQPADIRDLLLAIEVLSPGTAHTDRGRKREFYQRAGVHEYWIVDLAARAVERWRPTDSRPEILSGTLRWHPEGATASLEIDLPSLFREALGE
ncbi:MAG: Uma2 family endonuclease [Gemmatimonadetes bacterium]|nr:Uma2 family endonuclease [Gemmatimonadota bacterium]